MLKNISSFQNSLVKKILLLQEKSKERKKNSLFIIEGKREIKLAIKGGYKMNTLLYCSDIISESEVSNLLNIDFNNRIEISFEVYKKIAYRTSTEGIIAISESKNLAISDLK